MLRTLPIACVVTSQPSIAIAITFPPHPMKKKNSHVVRPTQVLRPRALTFSTFAIGLDRVAHLPFRARIPTMSHQQPQPIDLPPPSLISLIHAHTHTCTLSPSPFVARYFTRTPSLHHKWTLPTTLRHPSEAARLHASCSLHSTPFINHLGHTAPCHWQGHRSLPCI